MRASEFDALPLAKQKSIENVLESIKFMRVAICRPIYCVTAVGHGAFLQIPLIEERLKCQIIGS